MNAPPATIARRLADATPSAPDFAALRSEAIARVQALAGERWTDFNLHDPGVTFLEQFCYALTELVYRADAPLAEHLSDAAGEIDFNGLGLHPPDRALPCRATTAADYRRVLIDRVADLVDAQMRPAAPGGITLWQLELELPPARLDAAAAVIAAARAAYRSQRNLGEDLDDAVALVRLRECELEARIEIAGARDPAEIVAEVYDRLARHIAGGLRLCGLAELLAAGRSAEQIWDGPALGRGFLDDAGAATRENKLFVADLAAELRRVDGVRDVGHLGLWLAGEAHARTHSVDWRGERDVLALRVPGHGADLGRIQLTRRGSPVHVDAEDVLAEYADLQTSSGRHASSAAGAETGARPAWELPRGRPIIHTPYFSVQSQLPAIFGLAAAGGRGVRARAAQLRAYLALFEQVLANAGAQLQHLPDLFAVDGDAQRSYWWQLLGDESVPGIEALYRTERAQVEHDAFADTDDAAGRRLRALDAVLALHGQVYTQNTMRQFLGYLEPRELQARLLANKTALARALLDVGRDRGAGFDYAEPAWDGADNVGGLQRDVALLLGFADGSSRSLCAPFERQRSTPVAAGVAEAEGFERVHVADRSALRALARPTGRRDAVALQAEPQALGLGRGRLPAALLRAGVDRTHYRWQTHEGGGRLLLGPDENGDWWRLGDHADETAASAAADRARRWLLRLNDLGEGLHVVEHVLLRPRTTAAPQRALGVGAGFHSLRVTVVFPGWSARTQLAAFRAFAEETVEINTPAHVAAHCLWLDFDAMHAFEAAFQAWLAALNAAARAPAVAAAALAADEAAAAVIEILLGHGIPRE